MDHWYYTRRPGTIKKHLALYEENGGWKIQSSHLGRPVLYAVTETGNVNSYVHVWVYKDAADRARRRANLQANPKLHAYLKLGAEAGYLTSRENRLLSPASFFVAKIYVE